MALNLRDLQAPLAQWMATKLSCKNSPLLSSIGLEWNPVYVFVLTSSHIQSKGGDPCLRILTIRLLNFKVYPITWMYPCCFKHLAKGFKFMSVRPSLMNLVNSIGNS